MVGEAILPPILFRVNVYHIPKLFCWLIIIEEKEPVGVFKWEGGDGG